MTNSFQRKPVQIIDDLDTMRLITDSLRFQILSILDEEPLTINQVAKKMGLTPSRLYYHFKLLEDHGIIQVVDTRMINNIVEKSYWLTAEDIEIDKDLINFSSDTGAENIARMVTSQLDATREDILRSLQARKFNLAHGAQPTPRDMVMIHHKSHLTDETYQIFLARLKDLIEEFTQLSEEDSNGDLNVFALSCFMYPSYYFDEDGDGE